MPEKERSWSERSGGGHRIDGFVILFGNFSKALLHDTHGGKESVERLGQGLLAFKTWFCQSRVQSWQHFVPKGFDGISDKVIILIIF